MEKKVKHHRDLTKAITYVILSWIGEMIIVYFLIPDHITMILEIGVLFALFKVTIYFLHEKAWRKTDWGCAGDYVQESGLDNVT